MIARVLIVDDSQVGRKLTRRCLEFAGLSGREFVEAENGDGALAVLEAGGVDLLVTDLNMPVMDGMELLRAMAAIPALAELPTILMTSTASAKLKTELERFKRVALLAKPVSPAACAKALAPYLGSGPGPDPGMSKP